MKLILLIAAVDILVSVIYMVAGKTENAIWVLLLAAAVLLGNIVILLERIAGKWFYSTALYTSCGKPPTPQRSGAGWRGRKHPRVNGRQRDEQT